MAAELKPWKSFGSIASLKRDVDRLWDRFFGEGLSMAYWAREWVPSLDVTECKDKFVIKSEIAGVDPKQVNISVQGDVLTIKGEKKEEKEEKDEEEERYHLMERSYGSFSRSIQLPMEIEESKIKANYKNGVLKITLPKSEKSKEKVAKIKIE